MTSPSVVSLRVPDISPVQMKPGVFREEYIAIIVRELLKGLDYLHTEGKLHRDIKGMLDPPVSRAGYSQSDLSQLRTSCSLPTAMSS